MNQTIKLESFLDERYSFIIPSHGVDAIDFPMEKNEFGENNIISSAYFVKNDERGLEILKSIWECRGMPEGLNINDFDHEGRQCRITFSMPEFKPYVKIVEERLLNRFWYMNKPFMTFYNLGVNELVWKPGDFIVHVTGYSLEERIPLLSDLNYFSGGAIAKFGYENSTIRFSPIQEIEFAKILVKDLEGNILSHTTMNNINHKLNYFISIPLSLDKVIFEAYDENDTIIAKKLLVK
jgi:hypothetical protein